jgi:putative membrane protein
MQHDIQSPLAFHPIHVFGLLAVLGAGAVYGRLRARNRETFERAIPAWRVRAFYGGLLFLWIAVASPLAGLDHQLLSFHMLQHLLLSTVSAPLILLGEPVLLFVRGRRRGSVAPGTADSSGEERARRVAERLTHPVLCWLAAVGTLLAWHVPRIFESAMQSPPLHVLEQFSFFTTGVLFWWPVIRPWPGGSVWPRWTIPLYLLLATLPCDTLSAFLTFCDRVVYPGYLDGPRHFPISPLQDQECAGALMWVWVTVIYLVPAVYTTIEILAPPVSAAGSERRAI